MAIFQRLSNGPMAVHELAQNLPVSRPAVSQHLRVLKDAGLVTDSKAGTRRMYQLDPKGVARLRAHFDLVWERALSAFQEAAESPTGSTAVAGNRAEKGAGKKSEKRRGRHDKDSRGSGRSQKHPGSRAH